MSFHYVGTFEWSSSGVACKLGEAKAWQFPAHTSTESLQVSVGDFLNTHGRSFMGS